MNKVFKNLLYDNGLKSSFIHNNLLSCFSKELLAMSSLRSLISRSILSNHYSYNNYFQYKNNNKNAFYFCHKYQNIRNNDRVLPLNKVSVFKILPSCSDIYSKCFVMHYSSKASSLNKVISLKTKKRSQRKKKTVDEQNDMEFQIVAYSTADEYDLESLSDALVKQGLYVEIPIFSSSMISSTDPLSETVESGPEDVLHFGAAYSISTEPRTMYIFRNGAIVFWNMPSLEVRNVLKFLRRFESQSYDNEVVFEESDTLVYAYTDSNAKIVYKQNLILLNEAGEKTLEKFTFSNALAMSVKLGIWEASLDKYIESIEYVTEELQNSGVVVLNKGEVLQKLGQLFALRHLINLSSDLLDIPDFYWNYEDLENLYTKMAHHLSISKRTSVMNYKLNHCLELMELLQSHLNDQHSSRLEWIIILLIMIEVFFEIVHFVR